jgi:excisionase family DNA binding protein
MSEPAKQDLFALLLDQIRTVVAEEIAKALEKKPAVKLQFTLEEAAAILGVKRSWLGSKVRAGELPHHRYENGHRIFFTQQDIDQIENRSAVVPKNRKE